ncbi:MAG: hypothetical protein H6648_11535 [Caldilineae bacterium]|nr:hypothetical protein [Chloroflexota bacterium]MCB9177777.1 hypothetical protein [Caldilineae bacterium]
MSPLARRIDPGSFEPQRHFYPRALNAQLHPLVRYFLSLDNGRIAERYAHLHPEVDPGAIQAALAEVPRHFHWGGADLFHVATGRGLRRMVVIETNSSPSGQKSMPLYDETREQAGYEQLVARTFLRVARRRGLPNGGLAVLYDKNEMENGGYAAAIADLSGEPAWLVPMPDGAADPVARFDPAGILEVRDPEGVWQPMRAALRYVTQRPWNRIPALTRTALCNPVLVCLAGGRNKALAAKAYDFHNAALEASGLRIRTPETIWDVARQEVPFWVARMGGFAVVKVPYANAGQGIYTITTPDELEAFMHSAARYDRFVVQALVGNSGWSSRSAAGSLYHVGTVPDARRRIYVADLRFMVAADESGFYPVALYARRARRALAARLEGAASSWDMLGTNLSVQQTDGSWDTESDRLLLMDARDYNRLGLGLDDLIEGYLQTVLAMTAIDRMAQRLVTSRGSFRSKLFASLTPDAALAAEIQA